jgi:predicted small integral membrane protein
MSKITKPRNGFLPMKTNLFDRIFIGVVFLVALSLIWIRFLEPEGFSIWISTTISVIVAIIIARKG